MGAVHPRPLDLGDVPPVGPVHPAVDGVQGDVPRLVEAPGHQHLPRRPVQLGHLDPVGARVGPEQVAGDPVDGHAVRLVDVIRDDVDDVGAVQLRPENALALVCPVNVPEKGMKNCLQKLYSKKRNFLPKMS